MTTAKTNTADKKEFTGTVAEAVARIISRSSAARLEKLEAMKAPQMIIDNCRNEVENAPAVVAKYGKIKEYGDVQVKSVERRVGRGGKAFFRMEPADSNAKAINFFPAGQYGPFVNVES